MDNFIKKGELFSHGSIYVDKDGNRKESKTNSAKTFRSLNLPESELPIYNNVPSSSDSHEKSECRVDVTLTALDSAFPATLENWVLYEEKTDKENNYNNGNRKKAQHLENLLVSTSSTDEDTNEMECDSKRKRSLDKVCGLAEVKNMLKNVFIYRILYPQFFPGNIHWNRVLLFGPPGTGKSLLAKAVAEEINAVLYSVSSADLLSHWQGETEKQIRTLFEEARSFESAVVLFFDEIDGLCRIRSHSESDLVRRIKTELLMQFETDEFNGQQTSQMYLVGATNCPWDIDPAFLRRFHKKIYVPLPDMIARIDILKQGFDDIETSLTENEWEVAGKLTEGYSGSDLENVVMSSCCERLDSMMNCHYWKPNGNMWIPTVSDSKYSVRIDFHDLPSHQIQFRAINFSDVQSGIRKTAKTVTQEELLKFTNYAAKYT